MGLVLYVCGSLKKDKHIFYVTLQKRPAETENYLPLVYAGGFLFILSNHLPPLLLLTKGYSFKTGVAFFI